MITERVQFMVTVALNYDRPEDRRQAVASAKADLLATRTHGSHCSRPVSARLIRLKASHVAIDDQSKNGVKVIVRRYVTGTVVEASCSCFGNKRRVHSNPGCPMLAKANTT